MQMFSKELKNAGHTCRFIVSDQGANGWEVLVEEDSRVVRRVVYNDWHRVERAVSVMTRQVSELEENGWRETLAH